MCMYFPRPPRPFTHTFHLPLYCLIMLDFLCPQTTCSARTLCCLIIIMLYAFQAFLPADDVQCTYSLSCLIMLYFSAVLTVLCPADFLPCSPRLLKSALIRDVDLVFPHFSHFSAISMRFFPFPPPWNTLLSKIFSIFKHFLGFLNYVFHCSHENCLNLWSYQEVNLLDHKFDQFS